MAIDRIGAAYIKVYMTAESPVNIVDVVYAYSDYKIRKAQDIIDECTMLVADCQERNSVAAVRERRLRELVAVIMKLQELGLIE